MSCQYPGWIAKSIMSGKYEDTENQKNAWKKRSQH